MIRSSPKISTAPIRRCSSRADAGSAFPAPGARAMTLRQAASFTGREPKPRRTGAFPPVTEKHHFPKNDANQLGRASCRERECQYVEIPVVAVSVKKNK